MMNKPFEVISEAVVAVPDDLPELPPTPIRYAENDVEAVDLDDDHKQKLEAWAETNYAVIPVTLPDGRLIFSIHAYAPKIADVEIIGEYDTTSPGTEPRMPNAYAIPLPNGGFLIVRYGTPKEAPNWFTSAAGNVCCLYDVPQDVETIAERRRIKKYRSDLVGTVQELSDVLREADGTKVDITGIADRTATLTREDGQYILSVPWKVADGDPPEGWHHVGRSIVFIVDAPPVAESDPRIKSQEVYVVIGEENNEGIRDAENYVRMEDGKPVTYTEPKLDHALKQDGLNREQREHVKLNARRLQKTHGHMRPWIDGDEFVVGAKLKFDPDTLDDGPTPTWDMVENRLYDSLTPYVREHPWCQEHGITTGGEFGRVIQAVKFQLPHRHTPPEFFFGDGEDGKSKTIGRNKHLVDGGRVIASSRLAGQSRFLAGVVTAWECLLPEIRLPPEVYDTLKILATDDEAETEEKFKAAGLASRCAPRLVQSANHLWYCGLDAEDTRTMVIRVKTIPKADRIDPVELDARLEREARHYLWKVLNYELPPPYDRLYVPVIHTPERQLLMDTRRDPVERFVEEFIKEVEGETIDAGDFRGRFNSWLLENLGKSMGAETLYQSLRLLPNSIQHGTGSKNKGIIQNARWLSA